MENTIQQKRTKIESLDGLKVIFFLAIFAMHASGAWSFKVSEILPGSAVTGFFVLSGFGVAYNYLDREIDPFYVLKKLKQIYPIYLFSLMITTPVVIWKAGDGFLEQAKWLPIDLALLQSWTSNAMNWNGVAWFLSDIVFCYLLAPFLLKWIKRFKHKFFAYSFLILVLPVANQCLSLYLNGLGITLSTYTFPVFRLFDFCMGMLLAPLFIGIHDCLGANACSRGNAFKIFASLLEIATLALWLCGDWVSFATTTYFQCIIAFVFAFESGIVSRLFRAGAFRLMAKYNLELFLLHQPLITYVGFVHQKIFHFPLNIKGAVLLAVDLAVAICFRKAYEVFSSRRKKEGKVQ